MKIKFHPCGSGDFHIIDFLTDGSKILIDSGYKGHYLPFIKPILENTDSINLWILTHTHDDHIGGITKLIESGDEHLLPKKVNEIWFNWSSLELKPADDKISVNQGMLLRDKFNEMSLLNEADITSQTSPVNMEVNKIHILSPTPAKLELSKVKWQKEEKTKIDAESDYHLKIESLLENEFVEDTSVWNGGSIAVLIESEGKRVMFLADAYPSVIVETLRSDRFGCTPDNPIKVDCVKVSHHGSKSNTSTELLELIDCRDWVFCANGTKHGFPHKECIARIIHHRKDEEELTRILFNHNRPTFEQVFGVDKNATERYNFELIHLDQGKYEI